MKLHTATRPHGYLPFIGLLAIFLGAPIGAKCDLPAVGGEFRSALFSIKVGNKDIPVFHAAAGYSFANFDVTGPTDVTVLASRSDFWRDGCEVQPWRFGIRPVIEGNSIRLHIDGPCKLVISKPGQFGVGAEMLYIFANAVRENQWVPDEHTRIIPPGIHRENISMKSNERLYLSEGAIVLGSLNIWNASNVEVAGGGLIVHDGPQDPTTDEGWMHKENWHGITMHNSSNVRISDINVAVRSRTWMIQLEGCQGVVFDNIKVIGGSASNANQDGIDWLGCGDTIVRNSFFRCSDDIFAIYGNTGFYDETVSKPGRDVANILIEGCTLSTSISNIMRVGWPKKVFNSKNVTMRNCDIVHMGMGGCVVPFALAEFWQDPGSKGVHEDYLFEDIRLDNWYSLAQLRAARTDASVRNVRFSGIWSLGLPPLEKSVFSGNLSGITFAATNLERTRISPGGDVEILGDVTPPEIRSTSEFPTATIRYAETGIAGKTIYEFESLGSENDEVECRWSFGDGTFSRGARVSHHFADELGSDLSGSGRFRVILAVTDKTGRTSYDIVWIKVGEFQKEPEVVAAKAPGLQAKHFDSIDDNGPILRTSKGAQPEIVDQVSVAGVRGRSPWSVEYHGLMSVPNDGGYTFYLRGRDNFLFQIDGADILRSPSPVGQPCGTPGNTVQWGIGSIRLRKGLYPIRLVASGVSTADVLDLFWEGPGIRLSEVGKDHFFHAEKPANTDEHH